MQGRIRQVYEERGQVQQKLIKHLSLLWECYAKAIQNKIMPRSDNEDKIY